MAVCVPDTDTVGLPECVADTVTEGECETEGEPDTEEERDTVLQPLPLKEPEAVPLSVARLGVTLPLGVWDTVEDCDTLWLSVPLVLREPDAQADTDMECVLHLLTEPEPVEDREGEGVTPSGTEPKETFDRGVTLTEPEPEGEKVTGVGTVDTVGERDGERLGDWEGEPE